MDSTPSPRRNSSGLSRDIEILELLGSEDSLRSGGLGVSQVAQLTGRDKAVVSRTLATLAEAGLLERDEESLRYLLGPRLYALSARTASTTLVHASRSILRRLVQSTRETSHLCVLRGGNVLTLLSELSPHDVRTTGWAGTTTAAWRTPSGRALLSDWDEESLAQWYEEHGQDRPLVGSFDRADASEFPVLDAPPPGNAPVTDLDSLLTELARIREQGFALSDEELEFGVVAASAPIIDFTGRVVAAVNVSAPKARIGHRLDALGGLVARAARELSSRLGAS
ncbi:IclR family transcriptional regulator [Microbacterium sp. W4I20]|jgi:DNA-binding IclR family transcriptional regulator|uniref:IclR family transcriptional regulator n=1 Tax=Microbacterium sp. W4I20 TaxID=3042262 RepID=UPI0027844CE9|nr:IclR family transcriptional regulator [Microbacterium sp. W4I20]MDQ0726127.1 DNA-binding IclR family transcriptional regulator [Microbacterium sp. W4I20]